jgi:hypothetical protein
MMEKDTQSMFDSIIEDLKEVHEGDLSDNEWFNRLIATIAIEIEWHRVFTTNLMDFLETEKVVTREQRAELRARTEKTVQLFGERWRQATGVEDSEK